MKCWSDFFNSYSEQEQFQKKVLKIDYQPHEMCVNCVVNHCVAKNLQFQIKCKPVERDFFNVGLNDKNAVEILRKSPYHFAKYILQIEPREFQKEIISCTQHRKALRISRRAGKTHQLAMYQLWFQQSNAGKKVRIVAPREVHINEFFEQLESMIYKSPSMLQGVVKNGRGQKLFSKNPYNILFTNKSTIRGTTTGDSDGISVRSQSADLLILDETDYITEEAFAAIYPLTATTSNTKLFQASTPSGFRTYFYNWCHDPAYKEFHRSFQEVKEVYTAEQDMEFQRTLPKEAYQREILAEFTVQNNAVFKNELIDKQLEDYSFDTLPPPPGIYQIGVDWNESVQGVHIVIARYEAYLDKTRISNIVIVPPADFTQIVQVQKIIELIESYNPKLIVMDEGFGVTQVQAIKKWAVENKPQVADKVISIQFGQQIDDFDPISGKYVKVPQKTFIVQMAVRMLENEKLILPRSQDVKYKLVGQMRQYQIEKILENGQIKYSKNNVHTLEAMLLQIYGLYLCKDSIHQQQDTVYPAFFGQQSKQIQPIRVQSLNTNVKRWNLVNKKRRWYE